MDERAKCVITDDAAGDHGAAGTGPLMTAQHEVAEERIAMLTAWSSVQHPGLPAFNWYRSEFSSPAGRCTLGVPEP